MRPQSGFKSFIITKYFRYLNKLDSSFKYTLPGAHKIFRLFKNGVKEFFIDFKDYYNISIQVWSGTSFSQFTYKQLRLYQQMPSDMIRTSPLIISLPLPLVPYFIFPIAYYMYPEYLLSRHFWTEEQKQIFSLENLESRQFHIPKIQHYLETHINTIENYEKKISFNDLLLQIKSVHEVDLKHIISFKDLFVDYPFGLDYMIIKHKVQLWHLCRTFGISTRKNKLKQDLQLYHYQDLAIMKEGINTISIYGLHEIAFARGINPYKLNDEKIKKYIDFWLQISSNVDESSYSMLLHAPFLLSSYRYILENQT